MKVNSEKHNRTRNSWFKDTNNNSLDIYSQTKVKHHLNLKRYVFRYIASI